MGHVGIGVRYLASLLISGGTQLVLSIVGGFTGQNAEGATEPILNLSPYYSGLFARLLTMIPVIGDWFAGETGIMVVKFIAGWATLGLIMFLCFVWIKKIAGVVLALLIGGILTLLLTGNLKL